MKIKAICELCGKKIPHSNERRQVDEDDHNFFYLVCLECVTRIEKDELNMKIFSEDQYEVIQIIKRNI